MRTSWVPTHPKVRPAAAAAAEPRNTRRGRIASESAAATAEHATVAGARSEREPGRAEAGENAAAGAAATRARATDARVNMASAAG